MSTQVIDDRKLVKFAGLLLSIFKNPALGHKFKYSVQSYTGRYHNDQGFTSDEVCFDESIVDCFVLAMFVANTKSYNYVYPHNVTTTVEEEVNFFKPMLKSKKSISNIHEKLTPKHFQEMASMIGYLLYNSFDMPDGSMSAGDKHLKTSMESLESGFYEYGLELALGGREYWGFLDVDVM